MPLTLSLLTGNQTPASLNPGMDLNRNAIAGCWLLLVSAERVNVNKTVASCAPGGRGHPASQHQADYSQDGAQPRVLGELGLICSLQRTFAKFPQCPEKALLPAFTFTNLLRNYAQAFKHGK